MDGQSYVSWHDPTIFIVALAGFVATMVWLAYNPPQNRGDRNGAGRH